MYTQACDQKFDGFHSPCRENLGRERFKKKNFPHLKKLNTKMLLGRRGLLVSLLSQTANIYGCPTIFAACVDSHPQTHKCQDPHIPPTRSSNFFYFIIFLTEGTIKNPWTLLLTFISLLESSLFYTIVQGTHYLLTHFQFFMAVLALLLVPF